MLDQENTMIPTMQAAFNDPSVIHIQSKQLDSDTALNFEFGSNSQSHYVEEMTRAQIIEPVIEESAPKPEVEHSALVNERTKTVEDNTPTEVFEPEDDQIYLSESEHINETMSYPIMINVIH